MTPEVRERRARAIGTALGWTDLMQIGRCDDLYAAVDADDAEITAAGLVVVEAGTLHRWRAALDAVSDELGAFGD